LLGGVAVFADKHVNVIGHDGASVACVFTHLDSFGETCGDDFTFVRGKNRRSPLSPALS